MVEFGFEGTWLSTKWRRPHRTGCRQSQDSRPQGALTNHLSTTAWHSWTCGLDSYLLDQGLCEELGSRTCNVQEKNHPLQGTERKPIFLSLGHFVPPQPSAEIELCFIKHDIFVSFLMLFCFVFSCFQLKTFFFHPPRNSLGIWNSLQGRKKKKKEIHLIVLVTEMGVRQWAINWNRLHL